MGNKVFSTNKPPAYFYHKQPRDPNNTLVRFCVNETAVDSGWEYDEYTIEVPTTIDIDKYIQNHFVELRAEAVGGASAMQQLYANLDYISMMSGIDIPQEEGATNE